MQENIDRLVQLRYCMQVLSIGTYIVVYNINMYTLVPAYAMDSNTPFLLFAPGLPVCNSRKSK